MDEILENIQNNTRFIRRLNKTEINFCLGSISLIVFVEILIYGLGDGAVIGFFLGWNEIR